MERFPYEMTNAFMPAMEGRSSFRPICGRLCDRVDYFYAVHYASSVNLEFKAVFAPPVQYRTLLFADVFFYYPGVCVQLEAIDEIRLGLSF